MAEAFITRRGGEILTLKKKLLLNFTASVPVSSALDKTITLSKPIKKYKGFYVKANGTLNQLYSNVTYSGWGSYLYLKDINSNVDAEVAVGYTTNSSSTTVASESTVSVIFAADGLYYFGDPSTATGGFSGGRLYSITDEMLNSNTIVLRVGVAGNGGSVTFNIYTID